MEEILHHLTCMKPCKKWDIYHINLLLGISSSNSILPCLLSRDHSLYLERADHCFHVAWGKVECQTIIHDKLTEELADKAEQRGELQKQLMDAPIRRRSWDGDKTVLNVAKVSNPFLSLSLSLSFSLSLSLSFSLFLSLSLFM